MSVFIGYDAELAPLIYGGSDVFLMPSLFEPCGLGQLIAMRYGCVPVVRATGGLADTVRGGVTGFTFLNYSADDFWNTLREALFVYRNDRDSWRAIQVKGMTSDFSWESSARAYQQLYGWAIARVRRVVGCAKKRPRLPRKGDGAFSFHRGARITRGPGAACRRRWRAAGRGCRGSAWSGRGPCPCRPWRTGRRGWRASP